MQSGKTPLDFAAIVAGRASEGRDRIFHFMENARVDPARFHETARLLLQKGAELTPRAAVALGDREAVLRMDREGRLPDEIHMFRGGLLAIAARVDRLDIVATLLGPRTSIPMSQSSPTTASEAGACHSGSLPLLQSTPLGWACRWDASSLSDCTWKRARCMGG